MPLPAIHAQHALLEEGWAANVRLAFDNGFIAAVEKDVAPVVGDDARRVIVPGMANVHSHAFQRAMAGLAETRGPAADNFWSWRQAMYRFALSVTPEQMEAIAGALYMEMLEAGFTRVGEFHYLHNAADGTAYANIAEMTERVASASSQAGISLTLLPVFYAHSNFDGRPPLDGQRRFIHSIDSYARLVAACAAIVKDLPGAVLGVAPHSLRAVTPAELKEVLTLAGHGPVHIHAAEQVKEVEDCLAALGARPVEWLLEHAPVGEQWCMIHATHMDAQETRRMAAAGAVAGLCPITESNLGDGVFAAPAFLDHGGRFGIGSDSNVLISLADELRTLEYSQRLVLQARNVVARSGASTANRLFREALRGGNAALQSNNGLRVGGDADVVALDVRRVPYLTNDHLLDHWIFSGGVKVEAVWTRGIKRVDAGEHLHRAKIQKRFHQVMADLMKM